MRYIVAVLLSILFVASACSSEKGSENTPTSKEEVFQAQLHREFPSQIEFNADQLLAVADAACETLDEGSSVEELFLGLETISESDLRYTIMAEAASEGVASFCPEHTKALLNAASHSSR